MKTITWDNPNKQHFESAHKTFNRQVDCIMKGNVIGKTQISWYIRSYNELECNGRINEPGHLQNYDLDMFKRAGYHIPTQILNKIRELGTNQKFILYNFHHWNDDKRISDGWVLTTADYGNETLILIVFDNSNWRAQDAVYATIKYITC